MVRSQLGMFDVSPDVIALNPHLFKDRKSRVSPKRRVVDGGGLNDHEELFLDMWKDSTVGRIADLACQKYWCPGRNYRADFIVVPSNTDIPREPKDQKPFFDNMGLKIMIEIDGGIFMARRGKNGNLRRGAHSSIIGMLKDRERYNHSSARGWAVFHAVCTTKRGCPDLIYANEVIDSVTEIITNRKLNSL